MKNDVFACDAAASENSQHVCSSPSPKQTSQPALRSCVQLISGRGRRLGGGGVVGGNSARKLGKLFLFVSQQQHPHKLCVFVAALVIGGGRREGRGSS